MRRLLGDHYEGCDEEADPLDDEPGPVPLCQHPAETGGEATAISLVAQLHGRRDRLAIVWCAFGPPCLSIYFPLFLDGELPVRRRRRGQGDR